jgi:hypothetical protein
MADGPKYENSGNLFKNKKKTNPKAPEYQGNCTIGGQVYEMAAWIREGAEGKYMRMKFSIKDPNAVHAGQSPKNIPQDDDDSGIPF